MPIVMSPVIWKKKPPIMAKGRIREAIDVTGTIAMRAFSGRVGPGVLDGVAGFVRGDAERSHRRCVVNVAGKAKPLLRRIVVITEVVVDLDHVDVADVGRLQNFARRFGAR